MVAVREALEGVKFHTVNEVATALRVSKMTVYRLVKSKELESIKVGRSFRVREQDLLDYIKKVSGRGGDSTGDGAGDGDA